MTAPAKLNELNYAENPARELLERLGWTYVPREALAAERGDQREALLKERLRRALQRLNEWMTEAQAERVIFELEHVEATGHGAQPARARVPDPGMPLDVDTARGRETRIARFFDFDHPRERPQRVRGHHAVPRQTRQRTGRPGGRRARGHSGPGAVCKRCPAGCDGGKVAFNAGRCGSRKPCGSCVATRRRGRNGTGPARLELFDYNLLCVAHCGAAAVFAALGAPEKRLRRVEVVAALLGG